MSKAKRNSVRPLKLKYVEEAVRGRFEEDEEEIVELEDKVSRLENQLEEIRTALKGVPVRPYLGRWNISDVQRRASYERGKHLWRGRITKGLIRKAGCKQKELTI